MEPERTVLWSDFGTGECIEGCGAFSSELTRGRAEFFWDGGGEGKERCGWRVYFGQRGSREPKTKARELAVGFIGKRG